MLKGTRAGLKDPYSIMLSASAAESIFGKDDPINKTIKLDRNFDVKVTGVYEDLPDNTSFRDIKNYDAMGIVVNSKSMGQKNG